MREVSEEWLGWARAALEGEGRAEALPFLEAVAGQVAHRHGEPEGDPREAELAAGVRALELLLAPEEEDAAGRLVSEPPMLAAFFQNVDLLYEHRDPHADAVAGLVMRALERAEEGGGPT